MEESELGDLTSKELHQRLRKRLHRLQFKRNRKLVINSQSLAAGPSVPAEHPNQERKNNPYQEWYVNLRHKE